MTGAPAGVSIVAPFEPGGWRTTLVSFPYLDAANYEGLSRSWRGDVVAGLTVGVVVLPLALAFGITTGLGAAAGLTTAIVAGLVAVHLRRIGPDRSPPGLLGP